MNVPADRQGHRRHQVRIPGQVAITGLVELDPVDLLDARQQVHIQPMPSGLVSAASATVNRRFSLPDTPLVSGIDGRGPAAGGLEAASPGLTVF
ncbi:hypothetical protein GCM10027612_87740 [Microbispora bryophytorum subsp. camponoti]